MDIRCDSDWIYISRSGDDDLDDAQSISSLAPSSYGVDRPVLGVVTLESDECMNFRDIDISNPACLMVDLSAEIVRLRDQNAQLQSLLAGSTISEQADFFEVIGWVLNWFAGAIQSWATGANFDSSSHYLYFLPSNAQTSINVCQSEDPARANHLLKTSSVVNPDLVKFASVRLKAGRMMGSLFRPDLTSLFLRQRLRQRTFWIRTF